MDLPLSGKKMSLLALGQVKDVFKKAIREFYYDFMLYYNENTDSVSKNFRLLLDKIGFKGKNFLDKNTARDVLATSQNIFEETIQRYVYPFIEEKRYNRVIMVGGCALNITMNSKIESDFDIRVFTPPCPNDCGISLGATKLYNPKLSMLKSPFTNIKPIGEKALHKLRKDFYHKIISIDELAELLKKGLIVGTMIGPLEIGPRALGNRSYLASPLIHGMKNKINSPTIKNREFWRPVAAVITIDKLSEYFDTNNPSPYMTFAPKTRRNYLSLFREVTHVDGSSRVQTVTGEDGWIYHLLKSFGKLTGIEMLMNTSFNKKGHPLINDYKEAYRIFKESGLDAIVIDESTTIKESKLELFLKKE